MAKIGIKKDTIYEHSSLLINMLESFMRVLFAKEESISELIVREHILLPLKQKDTKRKQSIM